ncbi:MAG: hypothetical protein JXB32_05595 [Deltaproteobacteria bacterium]|nr:hypothetical protein [Deltaproteobacteria bacterium]
MHRWMVGALVAVGLLSGCTPLTQYRRSALTPAPSAPAWHGEPVGAQRVELGVQMGGRVVEERLVAQVGDPALWIPTFEVGATVMGGITDWLDLGGVFQYSHVRMAQANVVGTPPLPGDANDVWSVGPQLGMGGKFLDGKMFAGGYLALQYVAIPWATWELQADRSYAPIDSGFDQGLLYRFAAFLGGRPHPVVAVYGGLVVTSSWVNVGFSDDEASGSTLEQDVPSVLPLIGAHLDLNPYAPLYLRTAMTFPIDSDAADYFPLGWDVSLGVRL